MNNKLRLFFVITALFMQFLNCGFAQETPQAAVKTPVQGPAQAVIPPVVPQVTPPVVLRKNEILFSQKSYPISAIDPTVLTNTTASFYPGLRGSNQMIIYTPAFGLRTNTNEFGTESIINGNLVTATSGADSIIPRDGAVISGHGKAKNWMNENLIIGAKVYVDAQNKNLNVYVTSDSFLYGAKEKIEEAQEITSFYNQATYSSNTRKSFDYIFKAQEYLNKAQRDPQNVQKYSSLAIDAANSALATSIPYKPDELKGVWIRPTETSKEEIINTINRIHAKGIDNIFLETYFHGKTIFPSKTMENYQFTPQNEKFLGFDPLQVWIEEAHKRNIKVNIWFETFYVGNKNPNTDPKSILAVNPNWANTTKRDYNSQSATPSLSEHGGYFIDPANPDVQDFLEALICEIVTNYKPDGINLDYIRYPQSIAAKYPGYDMSNWGYTEYARDEFKNKFGKDPIGISFDDPLWAQWDKYRQDKITDFVVKVSRITKPKNILLTAVIFPDRQKALETKQQDWRTWSAFNYVDGFTPLLLTCDAKTANAMLQDVMRNKCPNTSLYAGLFITFMGGSNEDLIRQIHEARKLDTKGVIVFDYAHLTENYANTLTASVFDTPQPLVLQAQNAVNTLQTHSKRRFFKHRG